MHARLVDNSLIGSCAKKRNNLVVGDPQCVYNLGSISLLLLRLPELSIQCYSNGMGNLDNLGRNTDVQL